MQNPSQIRDWTIYKITNPSGNIYIGKTHQFKVRMNAYRYESGGGCNQQPVLYNSLKKYGFSNHKIEVIDTFNSDNTYASGREIFWIRSFMSNLNKWRDGNGMNLSDGGDGNIGVKFPNRISPMKGKRHSEESKRILSEYFKKNPSRPMLGKKMSEESKKRMSQAKKGITPIHLVGKKLSPEHIKKMSDRMKGKPSPFKGKKWSEDDKKRIGLLKIGNKNMLGKKHTEGFKLWHSVIMSEKYGKPVLCYSLSGDIIAEYRSINIAAKELGLSETGISKIASGKIINPTKFIFKFKNK